MDKENDTGPEGQAGLCLAIATCMKNAAARAAAWAESARQLADLVFVLDTGSTDDTIAILEARGVTVIRSKIFTADTSRADFEFDTARNEIADCIPHGAWILAVDADESATASGDWRQELSEIPPQVNLLTCEVKMHSPTGQITTSFRGERLYRNIPSVRWQNAMHNCLNVPTAQRMQSHTITVDSYAGVDTPANQAERSAQRMAMAQKFFGRQIRENPGDTRSMFYLAQTYYDIADYTHAIQWFTRYLQSATYRDEAYQAGLYLTKAYMVMHDLPAAESVMSSCIRYNPTRAEGYAYLGQIAHAQQRYQDAAALFEIATQCNPKTTFFVEPALYTYDTFDRLSMSLHKLGRPAEARAAAIKALECDPIPAATRTRISRNILFFKHAAQGITPDEITM